MLCNEKMRSSFEEFLSSFPFDTWITITFRKTVKLTTAKKRLKHFLKHLNQREERYYEKHIFLWIFYEKNINRKGVHIHALANGIHLSMVSALEKKCKDYFGESKVISGHENVIPYVAEKYNSLELEDFDYLKINSRYRKF